MKTIYKCFKSKGKNKKPLDITSKKSLREHGVIVDAFGLRMEDPKKALAAAAPKALKAIIARVKPQTKTREGEGSLDSTSKKSLKKHGIISHKGRLMMEDPIKSIGATAQEAISVLQMDSKEIRKNNMHKTDYYEVVALVDRYGGDRVTQCWPLLIPNHITDKEQEVRFVLECEGHKLVKLLELNNLFVKSEEIN